MAASEKITTQGLRPSLSASTPVFVGDTIYAETEVLAKRESAKRPTQGIVRSRPWARNRMGHSFISLERTVLVPKRGHAVDDRPDIEREVTVLAAGFTAVVNQ